MDTITKRIDLTKVKDLDKEIKNICTVLDAADYKLVSTFVFKNELILVFQAG